MVRLRKIDLRNTLRCSDFGEQVQFPLLTNEVNTERNTPYWPVDFTGHLWRMQVTIF